VLAGNREVTQEWIELISSLHQEHQVHNTYDDEFKLMMILDQCLSVQDATDRMKGSRKSNNSN
jgi:hypothetical protein